MLHQNLMSRILCSDTMALLCNRYSQGTPYWEWRLLSTLMMRNSTPAQRLSSYRDCHGTSKRRKFGLFFRPTLVFRVTEHWPQYSLHCQRKRSQRKRKMFPSLIWVSSRQQYIIHSGNWAWQDPRSTARTTSRYASGIGRIRSKLLSSLYASWHDCIEKWTHHSICSIKINGGRKSTCI